MFLLKEPTKNSSCSLTAAHKCQMPNADIPQRPAADYFSWFWQSHQTSTMQPPATVSSGHKTISLHTAVHQNNKTPPTPYPLPNDIKSGLLVHLSSYVTTIKPRLLVQPFSYVTTSNQKPPYIPLLQPRRFLAKQIQCGRGLLGSSHIC